MKTIISKRFFAMILALCLVSALFCGCGKTAEAIDLGMPVGEPEAFPEEIYLDETSEIFEFGFEEVPLAEAPAAIPTILLPSAPGTTVHIFYAVKMGPQYLERYERHFKNPDIRRHELQHEELLTCYPEEWVQEVIQCCGVMKEQIL